MQHRLTRKLTAAICALTLLLSLVPTAYAAGDPVKSRNINAQDYSTWSAPVTSYLYDNGNGLTRVEYTGGGIVAEDYDSSFRLVGSHTVPFELSIWGGFYAGADANYLIFGQANPSESKSAEVVRVVKYSKDWQRQGQTSITGANTTVPFDAGSLRCAEYGGYLYIHTSHQMFTSKDDGIRHQANMTFQIKESDMKLADAFYDVWVVDYGYVSHSFNQFILIDQDQYIVTLDHSDSNSLTMTANYQVKNVDARGAVVIRYDKTGSKAGQSSFTSNRQWWCSFSTVQKFPGYDGQNNTGASIGGFAETSSGYVSAYNYDGKAGTGPRDMYLGYTSKNGLSSTARKISTASGTTTPQLASSGLGGGYVMWNGKDGYTANDTLYYVSYSDNGSVGQVKTAAASLSDCQPISYNGKMVWYVTNNSAPVFYGLDDSGVTVLGGAASANPTDPTTAPTAPTDPTSPTNPTNPTTATEPTEPATQTTPATPVSGTKWNGIISDPNNYFTTSSAILSDGTLRVWYCYADVSGKHVTDNYEVIDMGTGYQSLGMTNMALLKTDGTAWMFGMPYDYSDQYQIGSNVKQLTAQGYTQLRNDGTVYTMRPLKGIAYPDNQAHMTSDAKQVVETAGFGGSVFYVLKNDGSLWSWSDYDYGDPIPLLGRGESAKGETYGKIMDGVAFVAPGMAIKTDGSLWSWGDEMTVGNGSDSAAYTPVKIMDNVVGAWSSVSADLRYALTADGTLYSWGSIYGAGDCIALGYSKTDKEKWKSSESMYQYQSVPRKVDFDDAVAVAPGYGRLIVQKSDGSIWAIGNVGSLPCRTVEAGEEEKITTFRKVMDGVKVSSNVAAARASESATEPTEAPTTPTEAPTAPTQPATQPTQPAAEVSFPDVSNHWARESIQKCAALGVVKGYEDGTFGPGGNVTYAEFITMLARAFYSDEVQKVTDTAGKPWYYPYMKVARDNNLDYKTNIINYGGWPAVTVADTAVNRYEMASILRMVLADFGKIASYTEWQSVTGSIKDYDQIPAGDDKQIYYLTVPVCYYAGILQGKEDGCFHGTDNMTRAEACIVIDRMLKAVNG